jgi:murein DD-endopeptidase MepM/ murein hydrolase activator NlpD
LPTAGATITPRATSVPSHTPATPCVETDPVCVQTAEHFWLERPIPSEYVYFVERTYPYGSTQNGAREPHHGVEFENRSGTPVIAAAAGTVVVAGDDSVTAYGPSLAFYGNLVVVQLEEVYAGQPVFNLYGHLSEVVVEVGQQVRVGETLGAVGFTGVAIGPHLHFEVRVGNNDYVSTRNPELWLKPLLYNEQPWGAIAGRVVDTNGNLITNLTVAIRPIQIDYEVQRNRFITTYAAESLNGDDGLQENFAISDMPLGTYSVSVNTTKPYQQTITVEAGRITWVAFVVNPPYPTATPPP